LLLGHHSRSLAAGALLAAALLWLGLGLPAAAHRQLSAGEARADGIAIPSLTHGQMSIIADNLSAIMDLADAAPAPDTTTIRLRTFVKLQFSYCLRGLMPGSLTDEASPFNECSHAYLAGARALILHLRELPGARAAVRALIDRIEMQMLASSTSLSVCQYSDEPFNTAELIAPHWADIPGHVPSLAVVGGLLGGLIGLGWWVVVVTDPKRARTAARNEPRAAA